MSFEFCSNFFEFILNPFLRICTNVWEDLVTFSNVCDHSRTFTNVHECLRTFYNIPERPWLLANVPKGIRTFVFVCVRSRKFDNDANVIESLRTFANVRGCSRMFACVCQRSRYARSESEECVVAEVEPNPNVGEKCRTRAVNWSFVHEIPWACSGASRS